MQVSDGVGECVAVWDSEGLQDCEAVNDMVRSLVRLGVGVPAQRGWMDAKGHLTFATNYFGNLRIGTGFPAFTSWLLK